MDPSSGVSGGSILGDKTRMEKLSVHESAYIRPSAVVRHARRRCGKTREAMLVCEAAGYDVVIVETVGVGQSETTVAGMTDLFVLLQLPNAGDDLQAMKKGVMELADLVVINKADIDPDAAMRAEAQITSALRVLRFSGNPEHHHGAERWSTQVLRVSALKVTGSGLLAPRRRVPPAAPGDGEYEARRRQQALRWMWDIVHARLLADFRSSLAVARRYRRRSPTSRARGSRPPWRRRRLLDLFEHAADIRHCDREGRAQGARS